MTSLSFLIHVQGRLHLSPNLLEQDGRSWSPTVDPTMIRFNRPCCPEMQNVKFLELHHFGPWLELALEMFFTLTPALALPTSMSPTSGRLPCRQFKMQMMEVKGFSVHCECESTLFENCLCTACWGIQQFTNFILTREFSWLSFQEKLPRLKLSHTFTIYILVVTATSCCWSWWSISDMYWYVNNFA